MKYTSIHELMVQYSTLLNISYVEYGLAIVVLGVCFYIGLLWLFFQLMFLFEEGCFKTLSDLRYVNESVFFCGVAISMFVSMAGMPPLMGFLNKLLLLLVLFNHSQYLLILGFCGINISIIYFYLQCTRFIVGGMKKGGLLTINFYANLNTSIVCSLVICSTLNFLTIFFLEDLLMVVSLWSSYIYS